MRTPVEKREVGGEIRRDHGPMRGAAFQVLGDEKEFARAFGKIQEPAILGTLPFAVNPYLRGGRVVFRMGNPNQGRGEVAGFCLPESE